MPENHDLNAVEALLEERDAIAGWLARLEERGSAAPEPVRQRVRGDYRARLDGLTDQLRAHADAVADRLATDRAEADALLARARSAREALAEVELRHGVGEYDDERFEAERSRHVAELEAVEDKLGAVGDRISRLEEVHLLVSAPARPRAAAPVAPEEPVTIPPEPQPWPEEAPPEPQPAAEVDDPIAIDALAPTAEDETDDLLSIFNQAEADEADETDAGDHARGARPGDEARTPGFGPLSFTPSASEPGRPGPPPGPPLGMAGTDESPRFVRPREETSAGRASARAIPRAESLQVIPDPDPVLPEVPKETTGEPVARTLRCGECGAMNRPLEWYCEKCGAELSAV